MAIATVDFVKNDSAMADEVMANRLGQMPLTFKPKSYNITEDCGCKGKGCSNCQVELVLKKKGPGLVCSGDIKSSDKDVQPVFDKIPITELFNAGDEVEFTAVARLGIGRKHAKWQGAVVGYRNLANISISRDLKASGKSVVDSCPVNVFDSKGENVTAARPLNCILCMNCVDVSDGQVSVTPVEESFIFNVESVSGLSSEDIATTSLDVLEDKLSSFAKSLGKSG